MGHRVKLDPSGVEIRIFQSRQLGSCKHLLDLVTYTDQGWLRLLMIANFSIASEFMSTYVHAGNKPFTKYAFNARMDEISQLYELFKLSLDIWLMGSLVTLVGTLDWMNAHAHTHTHIHTHTYICIYIYIYHLGLFYMGRVLVKLFCRICVQSTGTKS